MKTKSTHRPAWRQKTIGGIFGLLTGLIPLVSSGQILTGSVNVNNATCPESSDGSIFLRVEGGEAPYSFEWSNGESTVSGGAISGFTFMGHYGDKSYYRSDAPAPSLAAAQALATAQYGNLASVTSQEENDWIFANGAQAGDYLGGSDAIEEGTFRWASGETFDYTNWAGSEPNNSGDEDYIEFAAGGAWNDIDWGTTAADRYIIEVSGTSQTASLQPGDYSVTVTDANGLTREETFTVGPDEIEIDFDIVPNASCDETASDGQVETQVTGGNSPYTYEWSSGESSSDISELTTGSYTLTVTDDNDCAVAVATADIIVEDETEPTVLVKSANIYLDANGSATVTVEDINDGSFDDCGIESILVQNAVLECSGGPIAPGLTAELVVEDAAGNEASAMANITLLDTIKPVFNLESIELTISSEGTAELTQEMLMPFASDNCQIAEVAIQIDEFDCTLASESQATEVIVFDVNGNFKQQTLEVIIIDDVTPEVSVENITLSLDENGAASLNPELLEIDILDNCDPADVTFSNMEFNCFALGPNVTGILVTDYAGNEGLAEFTVTIVDDMAPEISGPEAMSLCEGAAVDYSQIIATDNCSAILSLIDGPEEGNMPVIGNYIAEFEATDPSGNTTPHMVMIEVTPSPEVDLGEDLEVELGAIVTLEAGDDETLSYEWSNGSIGSSYSFVATEDVTVSVTVTTADDCADMDEITVSVFSTLGIGDKETADLVSLFPNPTDGLLSIQLETFGTGTMQVTVIDISGKAVFQKSINQPGENGTAEIDLSELSKGIYLVNIRSEEINLTERIVKK